LPQIPIERHALDNGLRVLLSRDPRAPMVEVSGEQKAAIKLALDKLKDMAEQTGLRGI